MTISLQYYNTLLFNQTHPKQPQHPFISGLISGLVGASVVYPIDVVKTRMQNQNKSVDRLYKNGFDCCRQLWKQEKIRPFYRGCLTQLMGVGPEKAVKLFAYNYVVTNNENHFYSHLLGGLAAGMCQVFITCPYEMIKINLQMNKEINYLNLLNPKKMYTGTSACFLRDIPFSGIYFPTYWYLKDQQEFNPFVAGTMAGAPAAFLCTPADVVKTRMQTIKSQEVERVKILPTIHSIWVKEGFTAFWKGGGWRVLRSSPQFGVTLLVFEWLTWDKKK
jgi:solute carrier family 25 (mitochondrial aspartate/glutamate transporter), member 12/13